MQGEPPPSSGVIFAHVAVPLPSGIGTLFSYSVPALMQVEPGQPVVVPFGSRVVPAIVVETGDVPPSVPTRELVGPVLGAPSISVERVRVARWMARHYRAALFDTLSLFLPPGWTRAARLPDGVDVGRPGPAFRWPQPPIDPETQLRLAQGADPGRELRSRVRAGVLSFLGSHGVAAAAEVARVARCSLRTLRQMVGEGLLVVDPGHEMSQLRAVGCPVGTERVQLNESQSMAYSAVAASLEGRTHAVFLLHGVTGSGKTQVYLRAIDTAISMGRRAIVLVSEIAQTPEALDRYSERFPGRVALLHSDLPDAERWLLWRRIQDGWFDVVLGPRSALFAPVPNLGLLVLDEEHEPAYKQDERSPRYHARDVAIRLGRETGAAVLLGSATPSIESFYLAEKGVYRLLSLPERYAGPTSRGLATGSLPRVEIVDLRDELKSGNSSIFSRSLQAGLRRVLDSGEQAILFLNRRGSSTCVLCRDCGHVLKCRRCDVPLVYHRDAEGLVCHQCNRRAPLPTRCPRCRRSRISFFGAGTERVEEEVRRLLPDARVLRWDHDTTARRGAHEAIHQRFRDHLADILVGTQMVAKALDIPRVTLVGVVLADVTLHLPDFRAAERTFQLLAQVAGRAGRGETAGHVIIQTYSPEHYSVVAAARHDYSEFYRHEMDFRRRHSYPPLRRMVRLLFSGAGEARARVAAIEMVKTLRSRSAELGLGDLDVLGPAPAFHSRLRGRYRWQIVLAGDDASRLLDVVDLPLGWGIDVDPVSLL